MSDEFLVLQAVRLRGRPTLESLVELLDTAAGIIEAAESLIAGGYLRTAGTAVALTTEGRERLSEFIASERKELDSARVTELYEAFCRLNEECKEIVTAWQMTSATTLNDHTDERYDQGVIDRLRDLHERFVPTGEGIAATVPRLRRTVDRLASSIAMLAEGDNRFVASPQVDSLHSVWFEMHEELIGAAGLTRAGEAAAGRA